MQTTQLSVSALLVLSLLVTGCLCRPQDPNSKPSKDGVKPLESVTGQTTSSNRMSRLQKPSQGKIYAKRNDLEKTNGFSIIFYPSTLSLDL